MPVQATSRLRNTLDTLSPHLRATRHTYIRKLRECTRHRSAKKRCGSSPPASTTARSRAASGSRAGQSLTGGGRATCLGHPPHRARPAPGVGARRSRCHSRPRITRSCWLYISGTVASQVDPAPTDYASPSTRSTPRSFVMRGHYLSAAFLTTGSTQSWLMVGRAPISPSIVLTCPASSLSTVPARSTDGRSRSSLGNGIVGVRYRATRSPGRAWRVRINRRESVNRMLEHVGLKA
jgi:hypothetical protein